MRVPPKSRKQSQLSPQEEKLETNLSGTNLTVRTCNMLEERNILTVRDLLNCTAKDLITVPNFGTKTLAQVYSMLEGFGFYKGPQAQGGDMTDKKDVARVFGSKRALDE